MIKHLWRLVIMVVVSLALLAGILWWVGFDATLEAIGQVGLPAFAALGGLMAAVLVLQAAAWGVLNHPIAHCVNFRTLLAAVTVGHAGNILTPSTYLGGEPIKIMYVGRKTQLPYRQLAGTVLLGKYLEALSFVVFLGVATVAATVGFREVLFSAPNIPLGVGILVVAAAALVFSVILWVSLANRWTPLTRLVGLLVFTRLFPRLLIRLRKRALDAEKQASRVFCEEGYAVIPALLLYLATHVAMFAKPLAFFYLGWQIQLGWAELGLIFLTSQVLLAVQLTPSGVGTLDGGMFAMLALAAIAITAPQCAAYLLCIRFWDLAVVATGASLAARAGAGLFRG